MSNNDYKKCLDIWLYLDEFDKTAKYDEELKGWVNESVPLEEVQERYQRNKEDLIKEIESDLKYASDKQKKKAVRLLKKLY